jgi:hypothetical protein
MRARGSTPPAPRPVRSGKVKSLLIALAMGVGSVCALSAIVYHLNATPRWTPSATYAALDRMGPMIDESKVACVHTSFREADSVDSSLECHKPYGLGSNLLTQVPHGMYDVMYRNVTIRFTFEGMKYTCPDAVPYECWFEPVQLARHHSVERCNATYFELQAGLFRHVQLLPRYRVPRNQLPTKFGATHIRLGDKASHPDEWISYDDWTLSQSREFWQTVLDAAPFETMFVATDDCKFVESLQTTKHLITSCNLLRTGRDTYEQSTTAALLYDLSALTQSTHFYANYGSNMDHLVARWRSYRDTTAILGGAVSLAETFYCDRWRTAADATGRAVCGRQ